MSRFEEMADAVDKLIFPVRWRAAKGVQNLPVEFTSVRLGAVTISDAAIPGEVTASTGERGGYHVVLGVTGRVRSEHREARVPVSRKMAAVYAPSGPASASWTGPDDHPLSVKVDARLLEDHLETLVGHPISRPIKVADFMITAGGAGRTWASLIRLIYHDATAGWPLGSHPLIMSRLHEAAMVGLLVAVEHPLRQQLLAPAPAMRPRPVKRAIDVIEAFPDRQLPITVVARMVGVSARTLQEGFRQHVGVTPMAYARRVRLARAHQDLREADPQRETVAAIAHRWGFTHLGRFAAAYQSIYCATPSQTLRKDSVSRSALQNGR